MRGRDVNLDAVAGKGRLLVIKPLREGGESWDFGSMTVFGELRDERDEVKVGDLECGVRDDGLIEVNFPAMELGRYVFVVECSGESGNVERLLNGYVGYEVPRVSVEAEEVRPERVLSVYVDGERRRALWSWGTAVEMALSDALPKLDEATELLKWAREFTESFDKALRGAIEVRENYLYIAGVNTGHYLRGDDGVTPRYGSDGYWYLGEVRVGKGRGEDGITPHITSTGYWAFGDVVTDVKARGRDGLDGTALRRVLIGSKEELPAHEVRGVLYYVKVGEKLYDVYAWLEPDGWVNVKETYDIATSEVYGLTKLGTDLVVENGAPVGTDAGGNMSVPRAGLAVSGTGKLGTATVLTEGGMVGMNAAGNMMVPPASVVGFGAARLSTSEPLSEGNSGMIGFGANKGLRAARATLSSFGTVRLGSKFGQSNPFPYIVGIGSTSDGQLANNYVFGGALQHRMSDEWRGTMEWMDEEMEEHAGYFGDMYYSGLLTTGQFTQSEGTGLELLGASESLLAGVYVARGMDDERVSAVPHARTIRDWVGEYAYSKAVTFTRGETEDYVARVLAAYASIAWVNDNYYTKAQVDALLKSKLSGFGAEALHVMSRAEHQALRFTEKTHIYLIFAD